MTSLYVNLNEAAKCVDIIPLTLLATLLQLRTRTKYNMATILPNLQRLINQCMKVGGIKTWKELTIGDQQLVRLLFTIILSFNIAGKRIALFGATKYFDILMPKISDHLPDWLKQGIKS